MDDREWCGNLELSEEEEMGSMRKVLTGVVAIFSVVLLSSCSLLPFGPAGGVNDNSNLRANAQMEKITAALNDQDAAALKAMFSPVALAKATDIDARLDYLLSFFPNGGVTWEREPGAAEGTLGLGTELLKEYYKVSADGVDYSLFFALFTVNEVDPDNVGLYALGVAAWSHDRGHGPSTPLFSWASTMTVDGRYEQSYPGVFFPPTDSEWAVQLLDFILSYMNNGKNDDDWMGGMFSKYAQTEYPNAIDDAHLDPLYAVFPGGDAVAQEAQQPEPIIRENTGNGEKQTLMLSTHRVSSGAGDYWVFFAYFIENTVEPTNQGFYAIGVAPWTESGDSPAEKALFAWADTFDVDASVPPGIFISQ
jgi:hypothetical protein